MPKTFWDNWKSYVGFEDGHILTQFRPLDVESWKLLDPQSKISLRDALEFDYDYIVLPYKVG